MSLEGKKVVILVEDLYQDLEVWYPYMRLKEEGATVYAVGSGRAKEFRGKYGYPIEADLPADRVNPDEIDGVIVPGGYAPDIIRRYPEMVGLVKKAYDQGKVVAAICHGGWVLISAGILKGKRATAFSAIKDDMVNAGAEFLDEEVVVDGRLITSRKPEDLPAFMREIIKALSGV